jgi:hypothetical protein
VRFRAPLQSTLLLIGFVQITCIVYIDNPTIALLSIPETVPVKVGEAKFAFKSKAVCVG